MPGEALKRMKKEKKMTILTITGYPSAEIKAKILKAGAEDFLAKPFTPEEIKQKIETLMKPHWM